MAQLDLRDLHATEFPIPDEMQGNVAITSLSKIYNWSRRSSMWPLLFGLACCAIEMIATAAARYDLSRFGMEVMRASPRQSDLMIVSGTVTKKMVVPIVRLYNQMPEPKYVLAMGACASGGGPFKEGYNVVSGIDQYIPVDVYVPGCPPTPQALLHGLISLQKKIDGQSLANLDDVPWYGWDRPNLPLFLFWGRILSTHARWILFVAKRNWPQPESLSVCANYRHSNRLIRLRWLLKPKLEHLLLP